MFFDNLLEEFTNVFYDNVKTVMRSGDSILIPDLQSYDLIQNFNNYHFQHFTNFCGFFYQTDVWVFTCCATWSNGFINTSFATCVFKSPFTIALLKPLLNENTLNGMKNYYPVSNLSFMSKVMERFILSDLASIIFKNFTVNLLSPSQV